MNARIRALVAVAAVGSGRRLARYRAPLEIGTFGLVPAILTVFVLYVTIKSRAFAVDFHAGQWVAGRRLLDGLSPYLGPHSAAVLDTGVARPTVEPFAYPSVGAIFYAALALLPHYVADGIFTALNMAAAALTLRFAGVRDWRLYGLVFLWPAVIVGWQTANLTLILGLGSAAVWHYRDRPKVSAPLLAVVISLKLILWPLALWLVAVRRYRALAYTLAWGLALNVCAWAVLGYHELPRYLNVVQASTHAGEHRAYSIINLALHLGATARVATAIGYALAALAAALCLKAGRKGHEATAFALSIGVTLLATPVIWLHYFALLLAPLAVIEKRLGLLWIPPVITFGCPPTSPATWQITFVLGIFFGLLALMVHAARARDTSLIPNLSRLTVGAAGQRARQVA